MWMRRISGAVVLGLVAVAGMSPAGCKSNDKKAQASSLTGTVDQKASNNNKLELERDYKGGTQYKTKSVGQ
ncbi:MAG: hypothetical protein AABZ47_10160 [Planctomycetota bacterium]